MDFFGIGPGELLLILAVALIIFGPGRLPELARNLGKMIREFRKATSEVTREFTVEVERERLKGEPQKPKDDPSPAALAPSPPKPNQDNDGQTT